MFRYLNHRVHWKNMSFQIPDGFYLDSDPELSDKNIIWLISPEHDFHLSIHILPDSEDTLTVLSDEIADMMPTCISPIQPISISGFHGHHAAYRLIRPRYYELYLDLDCGELLNIVIWSTDDAIYDKTTAIVAALDIRREEE